LRLKECTIVLRSSFSAPSRSHIPIHIRRHWQKRLRRFCRKYRWIRRAQWYNALALNLAWW
jgi:hypothetical protein